jgi:hypothetical protein
LLQLRLQTTQNDTVKISEKVGYAPAVNGNSQATATPLVTSAGSAGTSTGTGTGLVIKPDVPNFFNFSAAAGSATVSGTVRAP